jgi:hypothetical protein
MSCLIFCPTQHLRQCKSTLVGILFHNFDPIVGHLQRFSTNGGEEWAPMELIEIYVFHAVVN